MSMMEVVAIPVLADNYAYLLIDTTTQECAAVDPVDAHAVFAKVQELGLKLTTILTTHRHWDHAGGNTALATLVAKQEQRQLEIVGGKEDAVAGETRAVGKEDQVLVGKLSVQVLETPCHTRGHVLYLCEGALFTGDTLFIAGCGMFFNGTPKEMHHALNEVIGKLPPETKVYCGHEYTVANLQFAQHVEPDNTAIQAKIAWADEQRAKGAPTIPSTVGDELATNPFMRVQEPTVQQFAEGKTDPTEVTTFLRAAKSNFGSTAALFTNLWMGLAIARAWCSNAWV